MQSITALYLFMVKNHDGFISYYVFSTYFRKTSDQNGGIGKNTLPLSTTIERITTRSQS